MFTLDELLKQRESLEEKIKNAKDLERVSIIEYIKNLVKNHELSPHDIFEEIPLKIKPKYKNPETGETWAGRGKTPKWMIGQDRTLFEIPEE